MTVDSRFTPTAVASPAELIRDAMRRNSPHHYPDEDHRPYPARHRIPETSGDENARRIVRPDTPAGEAPTRVIAARPLPQPDSLPLPLPSRAEGAALRAARELNPAPRTSALGRLLGYLKREAR